MAIPVLIYEDNELLRESVSSMIQTNATMELAGAFGDLKNLQNDLAQHNPGLILMDIDMPGTNGIDGVKKIRALQATVPVIMLTVFDDNEHVLDAIRAGASGYLLKKHISTKLFDAINEVMSGGAPMSPTIARLVMSSLQQKSVSPVDYKLTAKEKEILASLSKGNSYKLIAAEFDISIDTVRSHIRNIYEKLHVHSQTEAVSKAIKEKLV